MNKILCIVLLLLAFAAYGQQQERIAIMHTVDNIDSINVTDLGYLTNKLRDIASKILPQDRYGIMTQQSIVDRLGSQERAEKECREATCLADLGRKISADYISQGRIGRFSGKLTIEVELYRVRGSILIGAITGDSKDMEGLLAILESKAPKLFEDMQRVLSATPGKPVPPPEPSPPPKPVPDFAADEPYEPPIAFRGQGEEGGDSEEDSDKSALSLGLRGGFNGSQFNGSQFIGSSTASNSTMGFQLGLVLDIAVNNWFHLQPGLMYIQKGAEDYGTHYIEVPLLLSLKFSVFRINAGPYFGICVSEPSDYIEVIDIGISSGLGFDIGMFYIGTFFDLGLVDISNIRHFEMRNGTFGFNFGVNL